MACSDLKPRGRPCKIAPQPCCPGRKWNALVCGCVTDQPQIPQQNPPVHQTCKSARWICTNVPKRLRGEMDQSYCEKSPQLSCTRGTRRACICNDSASGGNFSKSATGSLGGVLSSGARATMQGLYGQTLTGTAPSQAGVPTGATPVSGLTGLGNVLYPGVFGQLDRTRKTLPLTLPFGLKGR